jgi:hypothetical protein
MYVRSTASRHENNSPSVGHDSYLPDQNLSRRSTSGTVEDLQIIPFRKMSAEANQVPTLIYSFPDAESPPYSPP